jgi:hypothetical protein
MTATTDVAPTTPGWLRGGPFDLGAALKIG